MSDSGSPVDLVELLAVNPDDTALVDQHKSLSWADVEVNTARFGAGLIAQGLGAGDHVAIVMSNRVEYYLALLGAMRWGLVVTPVKSTWTAGEVQYLLDDAKSAAVVTDLDVGREVATTTDTALIDVEAGFEEWLATHQGVHPPGDAAGYRLSYTSGTTGRPKAVKLASSGSAPFADAFPAWAAFADMLQIPLDGYHLNCSALYHGAPLAFSLAALAGGAPIVIHDRFSARGALTTIAQLGVRSTCMVPTMFRKILNLEPEELAAYDTSSLAALVHGGEPCPRPLKHAMIERFGPVLVEYYGFSEGGFCVADSEEWIARPGTVGKPLMGLEIEIVDDDGNPVGAGERGTVYFRSPSGPRFTYLGDEAKTRSAYRNSSSFTVGDVGYVDEDGYLFLSGRSADVIVSGGVNIYPAQIESVIAEAKGISDCAVISMPDAERGETPGAVLVLAPGSDEDWVIENVSGGRVGNTLPNTSGQLAMRSGTSYPATEPASYCGTR